VDCCRHGGCLCNTPQVLIPPTLYVRRSIAAQYTICTYTATSGYVTSITTTSMRSSGNVCVLNVDSISSKNRSKMASMAASTTMWSLRIGTDCLRTIVRLAGIYGNCRTIRHYRLSCFYATVRSRQGWMTALSPEADLG